MSRPCKLFINKLLQTCHDWLTYCFAFTRLNSGSTRSARLRRGESAPVSSCREETQSEFASLKSVLFHLARRAKCKADRVAEGVSARAANLRSPLLGVSVIQSQ